MYSEKKAMERYEKVRRLASECCVLLKSDGSFPVKAGKVALFGNGARHTSIGGTGGGIVNVAFFTTVEEGLKKSGFEITSGGWLAAYDGILENAKAERNKKSQGILAVKGFAGLGEVNGSCFLEPEYHLPLEGAGDTAFYIISRTSGEGVDRIPGKGDIYLTDTEVRDILMCVKQYKRMMLVLNVSGFVDLSPVLEQVPNILLLSQLGAATGDTFADIVTGRAYPSGKLASTYAKYVDYQTIGDFGGHDDTDYREGIYVGYRYFDAAEKAPDFPFGFGLSYTSFQITPLDIRTEGSRVSVEVSVKNTGTYKGKETIQIYVSVPEGKLDQPPQVLAAFRKTEEMEPEEEQVVTVSFDLRELRSFDAETTERVLEQGDYIIRAGNASRNTAPVGIVHLKDRVVIEKVHHVGGECRFTDWKPVRKPETKTGRQGLKVIVLDASCFEPVEIKRSELNARARQLAQSMSNEELAVLCKGGYINEGIENPAYPHGIQVAGEVGITTGQLRDKGILPLSMADGPAGVHINGEYREDEFGVYPMETPQNLEFKELVGDKLYEIVKAGYPQYQNEGRNGELKYQYCTAIPIGMALAQSWNPDLAQQCGSIVGEELEQYGVHVWLAPGMNIHRHILCGRNFEYFSEDPLLAGKMGSGIVIGAQKMQGHACTPKHFCCNNQEYNRTNSSSNLSERALRDIYLRPFEIVIKEARPLGLMSSYNLVNGEHTCQRADLIETLLRDEWGFEGIVMTDWLGESPDDSANKYPRYHANGVIRAGNDIMMPGSKKDYEVLMGAVENREGEYPITRDNLILCATRLIDYIWKLRPAKD